MRKNNMEPKQLKILCFTGSYFNEHEYPPTVREIMRGCDISSTSVVVYNLNLLEKSGMIERTRGRAGGIKILRPGLQAILKQRMV